MRYVIVFVVLLLSTTSSMADDPCHRDGSPPKDSDLTPCREMVLLEKIAALESQDSNDVAQTRLLLADKASLERRLKEWSEYFASYIGSTPSSAK